jgi:hypothetical protein
MSTKPKVTLVLPTYLKRLNDLLSSYAGVIVVNQSDMGHAGLNSQPQLKVLCKWMQIRPTAFPIEEKGTTKLFGILTRGFLIDGLTINKCSDAAGKTEPLTTVHRVADGKMSAAWVHKMSPVFNILPSGNTKPPKPKINRDALTILGMSGSVYPWTWLATVAAVSLKPQTRRKLMGKGAVCATIKNLLVNYVAEPDNDGYFPDILKWKLDKLNEAARNLAVAANAL